MISIVTVNWNSYDFLYLMIESLERYSSVPYELIVIDNSDPDNRIRVNQPHVYQFLMSKNIGHGEGLNCGVSKAFEMFRKNPFVMFMDVDCHVLCHEWDRMFIEQMKDFDIVGGKGVPSKPIRPACMFMKKNLSNLDWSATKGYQGNRVTPGGYDVAIKAYYQLMANNLKIKLLPSRKNRYDTANGEEWVIDDKSVVYHHWHGSHLHIRQEDFPNVNLIDDKLKLFSKIPWRIP
jgi:glycosyltransferase involved in cell wall biosynthesis